MWVVRTAFCTSLATFLMLASWEIVDAQPAALSKDEKLEQEFTDPLATLPQLTVRDAYSPATYVTNGLRNDFG